MANLARATGATDRQVLRMLVKDAVLIALPSTVVGVVVAYSGSDADTARSVAQHISFADPQYLSKDDVPAEAVEAERRIVEEISRGEGKPDAALPKIVEGRLGAFFKQVALLEQDYARDNKLQIKQVLEQAGLTVSGFARFRVGS